MSILNKREAGVQLTKDNSEDTTCSVLESDGTWTRAPPETLAERRMLKGKTTNESSSGSLADNNNLGFAAYKTNPFATVTTSGSDFAQPTPSGFLAYAKVNPFLTATTSMGPPPSQTSPKSPKQNPFSSPSPAHNPFMSFDSNNRQDYWTKGVKGVPIKGEDFVDPSSDKDKQLSNFTNFSQHSSSIFMKPLPSKLPSSSLATELASPQERDEPEDEAEHDEGGEGEGEEDVGGTPRDSPPLDPTSSKVDNGEAGEECLLQLRVKLFRLSRQEQGQRQGVSSPLDASPPSNAPTQPASKVSVEWVEVGTGPMKILLLTPIPTHRNQDVDTPTTTTNQKQNQAVEGDLSLLPTATPSSSPNGLLPPPCPLTSLTASCRLVLRRENFKRGPGTKLLLNIRLDQNVTIGRQTDKALRLTCIENPTSIAPSHSTRPSSALSNALDSAVSNLLEPCASGSEESGINQSSPNLLVPVSYLFKTESGEVQQNPKQTTDSFNLLKIYSI